MPRNANKSMPSTLPWLDLVTAVAVASDEGEASRAARHPRAGSPVPSGLPRRARDCGATGFIR